MTPPAVIRLCAAVLLLCACSATSTTVAGTVVNTGVAAGVAAVRRVEGDCYTSCTPGNACNHVSGLCERAPCGGQCLPDERCEESWIGAVKCVGAGGLAIERAVVPTASKVTRPPTVPAAAVAPPSPEISPSPTETAPVEAWLTKTIPLDALGTSAPSDAKLPDYPAPEQPPPR
ncbi:MAG TPA: hypothetical protein VN883_09975 [Myxococcales bacterium]|jgi:hypothetical protein|nr:hypothetical protein [Myxococcales bacterium]